SSIRRSESKGWVGPTRRARSWTAPPAGTERVEVEVPGSGIDFGTSVESKESVLQAADAVAGMRSASTSARGSASAARPAFGRLVHAATIKPPGSEGTPHGPTRQTKGQ